MNQSVFLIRNLLHFLLGWILFYNGRNVSGIGVRNDSGGEVTSSASHRKSIVNPFVTIIGAELTAHDFNTEMSKALRSHAPGSDRYQGGSEKKLFEEFGLRNTLSVSDVDLITSSWNFLKNRLISFAPKVFVRYLKIRPDARKMFPSFANTNSAELTNNIELFSRACTCVASLNYIIPHLNRHLPVQCPAFKNLKDKYRRIDIKSLGIIWLNTMQEKMDPQIFTEDVRIVWKRVFLSLSEYASD